jgi:hypothetical protein
MPSHHLIRQYADLFAIEKEWRWSGAHYQRKLRRTGYPAFAGYDGTFRDGVYAYSGRKIFTISA